MLEFPLGKNCVYPSCPRKTSTKNKIAFFMIIVLICMKNKTTQKNKVFNIYFAYMILKKKYCCFPAYNASKTLINTYNKISFDIVDEVILVDAEVIGSRILGKWCN